MLTADPNGNTYLITLRALSIGLLLTFLLWISREYVQSGIEIFIYKKALNRRGCLSFTQQAKLRALDEYLSRTSTVQQFCDKHMAADAELAEVNTDSKWKTDLWFDNQNHLLFCQISKVSSTTWVTHLLKLRGINLTKYVALLASQGFPGTEFRIEMRRRMFQLLDPSVPQANDRLFSFVFVREPFSRIVSSYYNKMARDWSKPIEHMRWMRNEIIHTYRGVIDPESIGDMPTPAEFVQYIVDQAEKLGPYRLDNHIKPMWTACPFCLVQFDVIGKIEDFDRDSLFILDAMNLTSRVDSDLHRNHNRRSDDEVARMDLFFKDMPQPLIRRLFEYCQKDYEMLGYPLPARYLRT